MNRPATPVPDRPALRDIRAAFALTAAASRLTWTATVAYLLTTHTPPLHTTLIMAATALPAAVTATPLGTTVLRRHTRPRDLARAELACAALTATLTLAIATHAPPAAIVTTLIALACVTAVRDPAAAAHLPTLVPAHQRPRTIGRFDAATRIGTLAGYILATACAPTTPATACALATCCHTAAALLRTRNPHPGPEIATANPDHQPPATNAGRWLRTHPHPRRLLILRAATELPNTTIMIALPLLLTGPHSATMYAAVLTALSLGAITGALAHTPLTARRSAYPIACWALATAGLVHTARAGATQPATAITLAFLAGLCSPHLDIASRTAHADAPAPVRLRLATLDQAAAAGTRLAALPLAALLAPLAPRAAFTAAGLTLTATAFTALITRGAGHRTPQAPNRSPRHSLGAPTPSNAATTHDGTPEADATPDPPPAGEHRPRPAGDRASTTPQPEEPMNNHPRRKSSYSADVNCVEAGLGTDNDVEVADTKLAPTLELTDAILTFPTGSWVRFLNDTPTQR
ncbi:MFS transporter [Embleya sp. NPDC059237]|uniref:MFS transporter n=1 Tax=Embleya sp. NPDC059237 TaxID=3346784 RepID=UPI0036AF22B3